MSLGNDKRGGKGAGRRPDVTMNADAADRSAVHQVAGDHIEFHHHEGSNALDPELREAILDLGAYAAAQRDDGRQRRETTEPREQRPEEREQPEGLELQEARALLPGAMLWRRRWGIVFLWTLAVSVVSLVPVALSVLFFIYLVGGVQMVMYVAAIGWVACGVAEIRAREVLGARRVPPRELPGALYRLWRDERRAKRQTV